ncbi:hypothetical protein [Methanothrix soehngenii]|jgi:hypothetical protein|uniref:hypothetical protein n=1 Tax=Methanothrix soehngenii TaxID=2223 RepID=UPI00300CA46A
MASPWDNVYWFSRILISSDDGGIGSKTEIMNKIANRISSMLNEYENPKSVASIPKEDQLAQLNAVTRDLVVGSAGGGTKKRSQLEQMWENLDERLLSAIDYRVLAITCEKIMVPINESLRKIPSSDEEFATGLARNLLRDKGVDGLATIINLWDTVGSFGCIAAERDEIVQAFMQLDDFFEGLEEKGTVLTAFCQEFERRAGQKRKGRAGRSVESATSFILEFFGITATHAPEHFTTGLEIDKWIKGKDGWMIGISCKRTLRERWKQAYTTDIDLLNRHKIFQLWHVITFDADLSDNKITEMGSHRAILYLPDNSPKLEHASSHEGMKGYVKPMSSFIDDLYLFTGKK